MLYRMGYDITSYRRRTRVHRSCTGLGSWVRFSVFFFFLNDTPPTEIYTLSLHDALPIYEKQKLAPDRERLDFGSDNNYEYKLYGYFSGDKVYEPASNGVYPEFVLKGYQLISMNPPARSEEHTSELQSPCNLVCRLLLEKK